LADIQHHHWPPRRATQSIRYRSSGKILSIFHS
jgi:hypothetical protein